MKSRFLSRFFLVVFIAAPAAWAQTRNSTGPFVELKDARPVNTRYFGDTLATQALSGQSGKPLSLATADFDEDGMPDLAAGYATAGGAGAISVHRGNVDALWPYGAALRNGTPPAFLPDAGVTAVPEPPDFMGAGDFDADGHWDIVTAKLGSHALYLLRGDGHGGFAPAEKIGLPGAVTALTTGEINRLDGLTDIAVAVTGAGGSQVLVFESPDGALRGKPETLSVPAAVTSMAMAPLDDSAMNSLAVAAGNDLFIFHGRDRRLSHPKAVRELVPAAEVTRQSFPFALRALAVGNFSSTLIDLAILGDDGKVHFFERPDADYQAAVNALAAKRGVRHPGANAAVSLPKPKSRELVLRGEVALPHGAEIAPRLVAARTSIGQGHDLLAVDGASGQIHFLSRDTEGERAMRLSASLDVPGGAPVAVLPMRLQPSAFHALVLLNGGNHEPVVAHVSNPAVFTVTTTADSGPSSNNDLESTAIAGSLRTAITNATAAGGPTNIVFNIPPNDPNYNAATGVFTIKLVSTTGCGTAADQNTNPVCYSLPTLPAGCFLDGYSQSGAVQNTLAQGNNAVLKIAINGAQAGLGTDAITLSPFTSSGILLSAGTSTVRGLIITGFTAAQYQDQNGNPLLEGAIGVYLNSSSNVIEGNFIGVDQAGAVAGNSQGISADGAYAGNTVGGTIPQARNVLSGNGFANFLMDYVAMPGSFLVEGNYVGTDSTGKIALGGAGVFIAGQGVVVGGTISGAGNLLSGANGTPGVSMYADAGSNSTAAGNLVQGNLIGTDVTGKVALGNGFGVVIGNAGGGSSNTVGGTTPAARNIISGNLTGVQVGSTASQNIIQGNYIGTDISGTAKLGNGNDGILLGITGGSDNPTQTLIGGEAAGAGNVISGNNAAGIVLDAGDQIGITVGMTIGNLIGTDVTGTKALGNQGAGILVGSSAQVIGGTDTPDANTIAFNGGDGVDIDPGSAPAGGNTLTGNLIFSNAGAGVRIASGVDNAASQNSIYSNGQLGINMTGAVSPQSNHCNATNNGANNLQNAPVLTPASGATTLISATATDPNGNTSEFSNCTAVASQGGNLSINGSLDSFAGVTYRIEFFQNSACDPSTFGQGQTFLTATTVTTDKETCIGTFGVTPNPTQADLAVTVGYNSLESTSTSPLSSYTYVIGIVNNGAASAANVMLSDPVPTGLTFTSASITQGTCGNSGSTVTCSLGTLRSGATATATIVVAVTGTGPISNTATVSSNNSSNSNSTLTITSSYLFPSIDHFSVPFAVAGSGALQLTVFGNNFYPGVTTISVSSPSVSSQTLSYTLISNQTCSGNPCQGLSITPAVPASFTASAGTLTFTVTNPSPGETSTADFTVIPGTSGATRFQLTGLPNPTMVSTAYTLAVTAQNAGGQTVTGYRGVVNLANQVTGIEYFYPTPSFNAFTDTPITTYQFTAEDNGVHSFGAEFQYFGFGPAVTIVSDEGSPSVMGSLVTTVGPGAPTTLTPDATPIPMPVGFAFQPLGATVTDANGNPVQGVTLTFTAPTTGASGTFPTGQTTYTAVTDSTGHASAVLTANQIVGANYEVTAKLGSLNTSWLLTNTNDQPASLTIELGNNQSTPVNSGFSSDLQVLVNDAQNNPVQYIPVTFTPQTANGATAFMVPPATVYSRAPNQFEPGDAGYAMSNNVTANGVAGTYSIVASVGSISVTFTETNNTSPDPLSQLGTNGVTSETAIIHTPFAVPLQAVPVDIFGNVVGNVPVTFTAPTSGASAILSTNTVRSDPTTGIAAVTATANGTVGTYQVTATAGGLSVQFTLTNATGFINSLMATGGTPQSTLLNAAFPAALQVTLVDPNGNPLSGQTVTFSAPASGASATFSSRTAITNSAGVASVTATANGLMSSYNVIASAPAAAGTASTVTATFSLTNIQGVPCDLNLDGVVNVLDVQRAINEALGTFSPANDLDGDKVVNVVDIQIVINGALHLGCTV